MKRVDVALGERSYPILIEQGLLDRAGEALAPFARGGRLIVVADEQVWAAQGARLKTSGLRLEVVTVPAGEASKSWGELERLIDRLLQGARGEPSGVAREAYLPALVGAAVRPYEATGRIELRPVPQQLVEVDAVSAQNALGNLVENAVTHSPPGTPVIV